MKPEDEITPDMVASSDWMLVDTFLGDPKQWRLQNGTYVIELDAFEKLQDVFTKCHRHLVKYRHALGDVRNQIVRGKVIDNSGFITDLIEKTFEENKK